MVTKIEPIEGSSNIAGIGYDQASRTLAVQFKNGSTYNYTDVGPDVVASFRAAESKGRFFKTEIQGSFEGARVEDDDQ
jgi:hypothetical protein